MADAFDLWRISKLFVVGDEVSTAQELKLRKQRLYEKTGIVGLWYDIEPT